MKILRGLAVLCLVLLISCDFKFPEKWENPSWELPLNIPFMETTYYFSGLSNDSTIFVDSTQTFFILFQDSLTSPDGGKVGIDSTFDSYFEIDAGIAPEFDEITMGPVVIQPIEMDTNFSVPIFVMGFDPTSTGQCFDCFGDTLLSGGISIIDTIITERIFNKDSIDLITDIQSISVDEGEIRIGIQNEYPFNISNVEFILESPGLGQIWNADINEIDGFHIDDDTPPRKSDSLIISPFNPIYLNEFIRYQLIVFIDEQQNPIEGACSWSMPCEEGWPLNRDYDRNLDISISIEFDHFNELTGIINQIVDSITIEIPVTNPDSILISGGKLAAEVGKNYFISNITNNFFTSMNLDFIMPNLFYDYESFEYSELLQPNTNYSNSISIADYIMKPIEPENIAIETIKFAFEYRIPADTELGEEITLDLDEVYSFQVDTIYFAPFKFEYINAIFDELEFSSPSVSIDNLPSGFDGFNFADIILEMNIHNQIGIPVELDLELSGITGLEKVSLPLESLINYPDYTKGIQIGESVESQIIMQGGEQITYWFDGLDMLSSETISVDPSITELLNFAPETLSVGGSSILDSNGTLAPQTYVWGDFTLNIPFSFIFNDSLSDMKVVPASSTVLQPMDENTRQQIDSSLVEVAMHLNIENHSPLAMTLSMMISTNSEFIPYYFDNLRTGSLESIRFELPENAYYELSSMNINYVVTESYEEDGGKISMAKFYNNANGLEFWSGRLFDLELPPASEIDPVTGHVILSGFGEDEIIISQEKMNWLTSNDLRYTAPILEFLDSGNEPRTLQTTNYFSISSYLTFVLNTGNMN